MSSTEHGARKKPWRRNRKRTVKAYALAATLSVGAMFAAPPASATGPSPAAPPALTIDSPTLVFIQGRNNISLNSTEPRVSWKISDADGRPAASGTAVIDQHRGSIDVSGLGPGYYRLQATATANGATTKRDTNFAVLTPTPRDALRPSSPFGVNTHFAFRSWDIGYEKPLLDTIAQVGFGHMRESMEWDSLEKAKGVYSVPAEYEDIVVTAKRKGITPLLIAAFHNPLYDHNVTPSSTTGLRAFAKFQGWWLSHFRRLGVTRDIETYNEYYGGFNTSPCKGPVCQYRLIKPAYEQTKKDNPNSNVVVDVSSKPEWHTELFKSGGLSAMDTVNVHIYACKDGPEGVIDGKIDTLRQNIRKYNHGEDKPIWITETGCTTAAGTGGNDAKQADYVIRAETLALASGVEQVYLYDMLNDGTNPNDKEQNFGLLRKARNGVTALAPKPGLVSQAVLIRMLTGLKPSGRDAVAQPSYSYRFGTGNDTTRVLWSTGTGRVNVAASGPVKLTDQFGRASTLNPTNGRVTLPLTQSPVFITGPVKAVTDG
ncbi:glycosyl hydrolase [Saccharopolyspora sp. NPDC050389]|uniref:glycosyl hydrolase n=1 Tax=Saccharopolyspora sp. NPDC050389 TaxID=3155516 RepID=UPI0033CBD7FD